MATFLVQKASYGQVGGSTYNGTNPIFNAANAGGDKFKVAAPGKTQIVVRNLNVATRTFTVTTQKAGPDGHKNNVGPITIPAAAGSPLVPGIIVLPLIDDDLYDGNLEVFLTYSAVGDVSVAILEAAQKGRP